LRRNFSRPDASTSSVSAAKPTSTGPPAEPELGRGCRGSGRGGPAADLVLLELGVGRVSGRKSATAAAITTASALGGVEHAHGASRPRCHAHQGGTRGRLDRAGTDHQRDRGPASERLRGDGETHLARRTVPDESDGVDRLPRRSGRHDDARAGEIARGGERVLDRLHDAIGLGHAARPLVAGGQRAVRRSDDASPSR
jgi:hypothetical protein